MAADSTLTTIISVTLVVGGMTAALGSHLGSPARAFGRLGTVGRAGTPGGPGPVAMLGTVGMLGTGAIMLAALVMPEFSRFAMTSLTLAVLFLVLGGTVVVRIRRQRPLRYAQRTALAVVVVDIAFMAAAMLLMPAHAVATPLATAAPGGAHSGVSHLPLAGDMMIWLVLVAWAFCAAVLSVPAILRRSPDGTFQLACSGCMITAMIVMAV